MWGRLFDTWSCGGVTAAEPPVCTVNLLTDIRVSCSEGSSQCSIAAGVGGLVARTVRYTLLPTGNHVSLFSIDENYGYITLTSPPLGTDEYGEITLVVQVRIDQQICYRLVHISVTDVDSHAPEFQSDQYVFFVPETAANGETIGRVSAVDRDGGHVVRFTLNDTGTPFTADALMGTIKLRGTLDFEANRRHTFRVWAHTDSQSTSTDVHVIVTDVDDEAPKFPDHPIVLETFGDSWSAVIGQIVATDRDTPPGQLTYRMAAGTPTEILNAFSLTNGLVRHEAQLSTSFLGGLLNFRNDTRSFQFTAEVSDGSHVDRTLVTVNVRRRVVRSKETVDVDGEIRENKPAGSPVDVLTPSYSDKSQWKVGYSYTIHPESGDFSVDKVTGALLSKRRFDREAGRNQYVTVRVVEEENPCEELAVFLVQVRILDVNDLTPRFFLPTYYVTIPENITGNTSLVLGGADGDEGVNSNVALTLLNYSSYLELREDAENAMGHFRYRLVVKKPFDYETMAERTLTITVVVADGGLPSRESNASLVVNVHDVNDNPPTFGSFPSIIYINETTSRVPIAELQATDPDQGDNGQVAYFLSSGQVENFDIDRESGQLFASGLDYEAARQYSVEVWAADLGSPALSASTLLTVNILDRNDNSPEFSQTLYQITVPEDIGRDKSVMEINVKDADSGVNGEIELWLENTTYFGISQDGVISTAQELDYENVLLREILLNVFASDKASDILERKTSTTTVLIHCEDVNDVDPSFDSDTYNAVVRAGLQKGTIVTVVPSSDADTPPADLSYSLGSTSVFSVDASGVVRVDTDRPLLKGTVYQLTVSVSDSRATATAALGVTVVEEVDGLPLPPYSSTAHVYENAVNGTEVWNLTHNSSHPLEVKLYGSTKHFRLENKGGTVRLLVDGPLDRESSPSYRAHVFLARSDLPSQFAQIELLVTVDDVNDNPPSCNQSASSFEIKENNAANAEVGRLVGSDPDEGENGIFTYAVTGEESSLFWVTEDGYVKVKETLDREARENYKITVALTDGGEAPLVGSCIVYVTVQDVDDTPPTIQRITGDVTLLENTPTGYKVVSVGAFDQDTPQADLRYRLVGGPDEFRINGTTGSIYTTDVGADRETREEFPLTVEVKDPADNRASLNFTITIKDLNDNDPVFGNESYTTNISSNHTVGDHVIQVQASDEDSAFSFLVYRAAKGGVLDLRAENEEASSMFRVNPLSGEITLARSVSDVSLAAKQFSVLAVDNGQPARTARVLVTVYIRGNQHDPQFSAPYYTASVPEETKGSRNTSILISASDGDPGTQLSFSLVDDGVQFADHFAILQTISNEGVIYLARSLDREAMTSVHVSLRVRVTDDGIPARENFTLVNVTVTDVNDNRPMFQQERQTVNLSQVFLAGDHVISVTARDPDEFPNANVRYKILGNNGNFSIDSTTGKISTTADCEDCIRPLDYKLTSLTVQAYDEESPIQADFSQFSVDIVLTYDDPNVHPPRFSDPKFIAARRTASGGPVDDASVSLLMTLDLQDKTLPKDLVQFAATDAEDGAVSDFFLLAEDDRTLTTFEMEKGLLRMRFRPDPGKRSYNLTVVARDEGLLPKTTSWKMQIEIKNGEDADCQSDLRLALIIVASGLCFLVLILALVLICQWRKKLSAETELDKVTKQGYMIPHMRRGVPPSAGNGYSALNRPSYLNPSGAGNDYVTPDSAGAMEANAPRPQ